jgi:hypothetical protein
MGSSPSSQRKSEERQRALEAQWAREQQQRERQRRELSAQSALNNLEKGEYDVDSLLTGARRCVDIARPLARPKYVCTGHL